FWWRFLTPPTAMTTMPAPGDPFLLQVQSSGQFLNVLNGSQDNAAPACQGTNCTTNNFFWRLLPLPDATPPSMGLSSNSNFVLEDDCVILRGVSVTIDVTQDIVCQSVSNGAKKGVSFQLNAYSQEGFPDNAWQQHVVELEGTQLVGGFECFDSMGNSV